MPMTIQLPFLSICPRIEADDDTLAASTHWLIPLVSLGLVFRRVQVDLAAQSVTLTVRRFWFRSQRRSFAFRHITAVTYGYEDAYPGASFLPSHDSLDIFVVGLRLANQEEVALLRFFGDDTFGNDGPLPDCWYWGEFEADFTGTQERESRLFAQLLSKMLGVPIDPPSLSA